MKYTKQVPDKIGHGAVSIDIPSYLAESYPQDRVDALFASAFKKLSEYHKHFPLPRDTDVDIKIALCQGYDNCPSGAETTSIPFRGQSIPSIRINADYGFEWVMSTLDHELKHAWDRIRGGAHTTGSCCEGSAVFFARGPCASEEIKTLAAITRIPSFAEILVDPHTSSDPQDNKNLYFWGYFFTWFFLSVLDKEEYIELTKLTKAQIIFKYGHYYPAFKKFVENAQQLCLQNPDMTIDDVLSRTFNKNTNSFATFPDINPLSVSITVLNQVIKAPFEVKIYSVPFCGACIEAKEILSNAGIVYSELGPRVADCGGEKNYRYTPQITINDVCIKIDQLRALQEEGVLAKLAQAQKTPQLVYTRPTTNSPSTQSLPLLIDFNGRVLKFTGEEFFNVVGANDLCSYCKDAKDILASNNLPHGVYNQAEWDPTPGKCGDKEYRGSPRIFVTRSNKIIACLTGTDLANWQRTGNLARIAQQVTSLSKVNTRSPSNSTIQEVRPSIPEAPDFQEMFLKKFLENNPQLAKFINSPNYHLHIGLAGENIYDNNTSNNTLVTKERLSNVRFVNALIISALERKYVDEGLTKPAAKDRIIYELGIREPNYVTIGDIDAHTTLNKPGECQDARGQINAIPPFQWFGKPDQSSQAKLSCKENLKEVFLDSVNRSPLKEIVEGMKARTSNEMTPSSKITPPVSINETASINLPSNSATELATLAPGNKIDLPSTTELEKLLESIKSKGEFEKLTETICYEKFKTWLAVVKVQPSQTMTSWITPQGQFVIRKILDTCSPLFCEAVFREIGSENIDTPLISLEGDTVRSYLTKRCSGENYLIEALLRHYSKANVSNSHQMLAFSEVIKEKEALQFTDRKQNSWSKTTAIEASEGVIQGGVDFASRVVLDRLQCFQPIRSLPFWLKWLIPTLVYSFVQASVSLIRYPILGPTVLEDDSEEAAETQALLSALATYFLANLATGIPLRLAVEGLRKVINYSCENHPRLQSISLAFLAYLGALSNLPSLLLSQETYTGVAQAGLGWVVNIVARGTTYTLLDRVLGNRLAPPKEAKPEEGEEMEGLNPSGRATPLYHNTIFASNRGSATPPPLPARTYLSPN